MLFTDSGTISNHAVLVVVKVASESSESHGAARHAFANLSPARATLFWCLLGDCGVLVSLIAALCCTVQCLLRENPICDLLAGKLDFTSKESSLCRQAIDLAKVSYMHRPVLRPVLRMFLFFFAYLRMSQKKAHISMLVLHAHMFFA